MKKNKTVLFLVLCALLTLGISAETYTDLKVGLQAALPAGHKVFKTTITLNDAQASAINAKGGGDYQKGDQFTFYYSKDAQGVLSGYAVEMTEILPKYSAYHRWVIGFKADKSLSAVTILELTNDHTYNMGKAGFQKQFTGKNPAKVKLAAGVDAVTGATESSQLLVDSIQRAYYLLGQITFN